jgi:hypothetical protein
MPTVMGVWERMPLMLLVVLLPTLALTYVGLEGGAKICMLVIVNGASNM